MTSRNRFRDGIVCAMPRYKYDWHKICAILPVYLRDGTNGTQIIYDGGTCETVPNRVQWVLDDLLGYLHTSREVLVHQCKQYMSKDARRVPLIVSEEFSLMPVKGREELCKGDSTVGYIVTKKLMYFVSGEGKRMAYFIGGGCVEVLDTQRTLSANMKLIQELRDKVLWQSTQSQSVGA